MNLLMITGDRALAAGKQGAFYNTLEELHKHFDRIDIICPRVRPARYGMSVFGNVFVHPSPWPLVFQWFWIVWKGRQIIRHSTFDIRHSIMTVHEYAPVFNGIGAALLHRLTGVPYVLEVMHVTGLPRASGPWEWLNRVLLHFFISWEARWALAVRVINQRETPEFLVAAGVPHAKLLYVPAFYIDLDIFKPVNVEKRYDLAFVGRMARNKGIGLFLDVVRLTGLKALIVGDGPLRKKLETRNSKLETPAVFHGYAKDAAEVASLINRSRLLVMVSDSEGGPRVVLEAMACGVPVVATPVGIVPDVLPPEAIEEWDAAALADKVRNILADETLYARLRETGLQAAQRFERRAAIAAYADALKKLAPHA